MHVPHPPPYFLFPPAVATFRKDNSIPMLAEKVTDLDPLNLGKGYTWSHRWGDKVIRSLVWPRGRKRAQHTGLSYDLGVLQLRAVMGTVS